jgi:hypothetical protein
VAEAVTKEVNAPKQDKRGTPYYDVVGPDGSPICRVGNYNDAVLEDTDGASRLLDYIPVFTTELAKGKWGGFILDSVTSYADSAFLYHEHTLNPDTEAKNKGGSKIQWYGGESKMTSDVVAKSLPGFACHVGVAFHVHRRTTNSDGEKVKSVRQPYVPGKRMEETKRVASAWPELYRLHVRQEGDEWVRVLQTDSEGQYQCGSCLDIPSGMIVPKTLPKDFLWGKGAKPAEMHVAVMADPHVGKTTFLAQLFQQLCSPLPFYVALFDSRGKDAAYRRLGTVA